MATVLRFFLIFFIVHTPIWASDALSTWYIKSADNKVVINIDMFLSSDCAHCHKVDEFFHDIEAASPGLHVTRYFINQDKKALFRFNQLLNDQQMEDFAVPSIYFCNSRWVGFSSAESTGKDLVDAINYCKQQIENKGTLTQDTVNTLRHWANANRYTSGLVEKPSLISYTITLGLIDSFSPCALFCVAGFFAFLLIEEDKKKQTIAGLLYISSVALVHYYQQVYTSSFFGLIPWLRIPAALLGLVTLYFVMRSYNNKSNGLLYFIVTFLLGLITTLYQQTCVMSLSAIFQQWLNNQSLPNGKVHLFQLLYQSMYILPLIVILCLFLAVFQTKRFASLKIRLVPVGLLVLIAIALCLILYPFALSNFVLSLLILLILGACGFFIKLT